MDFPGPEFCSVLKERSLTAGIPWMAVVLAVFFTLVTGPRRSLSLQPSDTRVYEPQIRARLGSSPAGLSPLLPPARLSIIRLNAFSPWQSCRQSSQRAVTTLPLPGGERQRLYGRPRKRSAPAPTAPLPRNISSSLGFTSTHTRLSLSCERGPGLATPFLAMHGAVPSTIVYRQVF